MKVLLPLALVVAAVTLTGCASAAPTPKASPRSTSFETDGHITVPLAYYPAAEPAQKPGDICTAKEGYDDIADGGQVVVANADGKTVGVGEIATGYIADEGQTTLYFGHCVFSFSVTVKGKSDFYSIAVGNDARGSVKQTAAEMKAGPDLSLGD